MLNLIGTVDRERSQEIRVSLSGARADIRVFERDGLGWKPCEGLTLSHHQLEQLIPMLQIAASLASSAERLAAVQRQEEGGANGSYQP